jgi:hypothetical protein
MKRMTAFAVTSTVLSLLMVTGCGASVPRTLSGGSQNSTGVTTAPQQSTSTTAGALNTSDSNIGAKGVSNHISAKQQTQAQAAVNQLVTTINQLH